MAQAPPVSPTISALEAFGVALTATVLARVRERKDGRASATIALDGLPGVVASLLYFTTHNREPLRTTSLLTNAFFSSGSVPVEFRYDAHEKERGFLSDVTNDLALEGSLQTEIVLPVYSIEEPPAHMAGQHAVFRFKLFPSYNLSAVANDYTWSDIELQPVGDPSHELHLSARLARALQKLGDKQLEYRAVHPTAIAFDAIEVLASSAANESVLHLCFLVRVIFTLEHESASHGVEGFWLEPRMWYLCLLRKTDEELQNLEAGFAKFNDTGLIKKLASWEAKHTQTEIPDRAYTRAFQSYATIIQNTFEHKRELKRAGQHIMLGQAHRYPFLEASRRPSVASHSSQKKTPRYPSTVIERDEMPVPPRRNLLKDQPSDENLRGLLQHPGTEWNPYAPGARDSEAEAEYVPGSAIDEEPAHVPGRKDSTANPESWPGSQQNSQQNSPTISRRPSRQDSWPQPGAPPTSSRGEERRPGPRDRLTNVFKRINW